jgi:V8-like Glu-specific endopeptidase
MATAPTPQRNNKPTPDLAIPVGSTPSIFSAAAAPRLSRAVDYLPQITFDPSLTQVEDPADPILRPVAQLIVNGGTGDLTTGTGWFVSGSVLVTAAHVLYFRDQTGKIVQCNNVTVIPGQTVSGPGSFTSPKISRLVCSKRWMLEPDLSTDYAGIMLSEDAGVGWFGLGVFKNQDLFQDRFNVVGYAALQPAGLYTCNGSLDPTTNQAQLFYRISTNSGQSGAPVYTLINGQPWAAGIHVGNENGLNCGVRISQEVYEEIMSWTTQP